MVLLVSWSLDIFSENSGRRSLCSVSFCWRWWVGWTGEECKDGGGVEERHNQPTLTTHHQSYRSLPRFHSLWVVVEVVEWVKVGEVIPFLTPT